jgi:hypothetical protein
MLPPIMLPKTPITSFDFLFVSAVSSLEQLRTFTHILACTLLAGCQVHNVPRAARQMLMNFVLLSCIRTFKVGTLNNGITGMAFLAFETPWILQGGLSPFTQIAASNNPLQVFRQPGSNLDMLSNSPCFVISCQVFFTFPKPLVNRGVSNRVGENQSNFIIFLWLFSLLKNQLLSIFFSCLPEL